MMENDTTFLLENRVVSLEAQVTYLTQQIRELGQLVQIKNQVSIRDTKKADYDLEQYIGMWSDFSEEDLHIFEDIVLDRDKVTRRDIMLDVLEW